MKVTRWKGGLKEGYRSEADMTNGYFNTEFKFKRNDQQTDETLEWQMGISELRHALVSSRKEGEQFVSKKDVEDSVHTDMYYTNRLGGGLIYLDRDDPMTRRSAVRIGSPNIDIVTLGNPESGLDVVVDSDKTFRIIEAIGDPEWRDIEIPQDTTELLDDWEFEFSAIRTDIFTGQRLLMEGPGVPYRYSLTSPSGRLWYENITEYEFNEVPEVYNQFVIDPSGMTEIVYPDPFFFEAGTTVLVRIQTKIPTIRVGTIIPGVGFLQSTQAQTQTPRVTEIHPELIADASNIYCSEWSLISLKDPQPNTLHTTPWGLLVDQDCEPYLFEN